MAGVALGDTHLRFTWHAWRSFVSRGSLWHWARSGGSLGAWGPLVARRGDIRRGLATSTYVLCGRRGAWRHPPALCVAGVELGDIHLRFASQVWHLWHWAGSGGALRAGRPAWRHAAWHLLTSTLFLRGRRGAYGTGLGLVARLRVGRPGRRGALPGRRGAWRHPPALCVAGVARGDIHLRGTRGAWRPRPSFGEASVALGDIHAARCCK